MEKKYNYSNYEYRRRGAADKELRDETSWTELARGRDRHSSTIVAVSDVPILGAYKNPNHGKVRDSFGVETFVDNDDNMILVGETSAAGFQLYGTHMRAGLLYHQLPTSS